MERVSVEDVEPTTLGRDIDRRGLTEPLGTTDVAINRYRLEPGQRFAGLHAHVDQEEVFVIVEGEATFETFTPQSRADSANSDVESEAGEVVVEAGEAIRFAPGEFQSGKNELAGEVVALALGAPRDSDDVRIPLACPDCGRADRRPTVAEDGETPVLACPDCGSESEATCPECGGGDMLAVLADDGETPVGVCQSCGAESAR